MSASKQDTALVTYTDTSKESDVDDIRNDNTQTNEEEGKSALTDLDLTTKEKSRRDLKDEDISEGKCTSKDDVNEEDTGEGKAGSNDNKEKKNEVDEEESDEPWYINYKVEDGSEELFDEYGSEKDSSTDKESSETEDLGQDENVGEQHESSSEDNNDNPGIWCGRRYYSYRFGEHLSSSMSKFDTRLTPEKSKYEYKGRTVDDFNINYYRKNTKFCEDVLRTDFLCDIMSGNRQKQAKKAASTTDDDDSDTVSCEENYYYSENFENDDDDNTEGGNNVNEDKSGGTGLDEKDTDAVKEQGENNDKNTNEQHDSDQCKETDGTGNGDDGVEIGTASIEYEADQETTTEGESSFSKHYREVEEEDNKPLRPVIQATKIETTEKSNISLSIHQVGMSEEEVDVTVEDITIQPTIIANYASSDTLDPSAEGNDDTMQSQNTDDGSFAEDAQEEDDEDLEAINGSNAPFLYDDRLRSHIALCEYTNSEKILGRR